MCAYNNIRYNIRGGTRIIMCAAHGRTLRMYVRVYTAGTRIQLYGGMRYARNRVRISSAAVCRCHRVRRTRAKRMRSERGERRRPPGVSNRHPRPNDGDGAKCTRFPPSMRMRAGAVTYLQGVWDTGDGSPPRRVYKFLA